MQLREVNIDTIKPYENNPRINDKAVDAVAESIRQCGYIAPIIVDENMVVLAGHTRLKALKKLERKTVQIGVAEGLTEEQKKKYRLLDNKTSECADWDFEALEKELEGLDFEGFNFGFGDVLPEDIFDDTEDLKSSYSPPEKAKLKCPCCGAVEEKSKFVKV